LAGNLTTEQTASGGSRSFTHDAANRLTTITPSSGPSATFTFDGLGRPRTRQLSGGPTTFTYGYVGASDTVWELASGTTTRAVVDATDARIATKVGATGSYQLSDLLGSVVAVEHTDATTIEDAFRYDAWGQTIATHPGTGSAQPGASGGCSTSPRPPIPTPPAWAPIRST
jgi:YD repeat-containing protein